MLIWYFHVGVCVVGVEEDNLVLKITVGNGDGVFSPVGQTNSLSSFCLVHPQESGAFLFFTEFPRMQRKPHTSLD